MSFLLISKVLCTDISRHRDVGILNESKSDVSDLHVHTFYVKACHGVRLVKFSQRLEQFVLEGMKALATFSNRVVTPLDCIVCFFYGHGCYIDSSGELAIGGRRGICSMMLLYTDNNNLTDGFFSARYREIILE